MDLPNSHGDQALPQPPQDAPIAQEYALREEYAKTEFTIRSFGGLYYFFGTMTGLLGLIMGMLVLVPLFAGPGTTSGMVEMVPIIIVGVLYFAIAVIYFALGYGLRNLARWCQVPVFIFSALSMISIPIGTIVGLYMICTMATKKGSFVFSEEYQHAIAMTPDFKYKLKTSPVAWAILALLIVAVVVLIIAFSVSAA